MMLLLQLLPSRDSLSVCRQAVEEGSGCFGLPGNRDLGGCTSKGFVSEQTTIEDCERARGIEG